MTIVGVAGRDSVEAMEDFVARNDVDGIDHLADVGDEVWEINRIPAQPAWVFIDGQTGETFTEFGELGTETLTGILEQLGG